ncbi:MAG: hypothetical protein QGI45_08810, partial [Myxococcota bacterium]|nr:hypothetical protein [Myxococcota bacterium]
CLLTAASKGSSKILTVSGAMRFGVSAMTTIWVDSSVDSCALGALNPQKKTSIAKRLRPNTPIALI